MYTPESINPLISFPIAVISIEWQSRELFIPTAPWLEDFLMEESMALNTKKDALNRQKERE